MKNLRFKALGIVLLVLLLTQLSVLAFIIWQDRIAATARVGDQLEATARMTGQLYATRLTQSAQEGLRLASDAQLRQALSKGDSDYIRQLVGSKVPVSPGSFVVLIDRQDGVSHWAGGTGTEVFAAGLQQFLSDNPLKEGSTVVDLGDHVVSLFARNIDVRPFIVVTGFEPVLVLGKGLKQLSDSSISVSVIDQAQPSNKKTPESIVLELDNSEFGRLAVTLDLSSSEIFSGHRKLVAKLIAQALAAFGLAFLLSAILFGKFFRSYVQQPLKALRHAVRKIQEGDFQEPFKFPGGAPFNSLALDLERMREAVSDRESRIMHHAEYDALTGLTNRSVITEKLKMALARAERNGSVVSALAIDLSRFSEINGSLGHDVGDSVLKEIARRLASNARVTDTVARVGGDEFFVILEDSNPDLAHQLSKFMVSSLLAPIHINGTELKLGTHAGVAFYPQHCDSAEALRRMANIALYTSKENKSPLVVYEAGQDEKHLRELAIIHDLPQAIKNHELYLQYQPKIDMETQEVKQVEALVRWRHPQLGFIPPDEFIALLERSGLIGRLTDWVFKQAVKQSRDWKEAGFDIAIAVNISANDLADDKLPDRLKLLLHHYLVDASMITIEVTESAVIKDPENSVRVLNELREAGVKISLDDFGTGQTSLALLKQLPISEIKIDKSFVLNLRADSGDAIIVKSIIDLGHNMGLHVVAEGVESNYCWNLLNSYGCDLVQGYLVSAPLTAEELGEWHLRLQDRHVNKLDLSFVQGMAG